MKFYEVSTGKEVEVYSREKSISFIHNIKDRPNALHDAEINVRTNSLHILGYEKVHGDNAYKMVGITLVTHKPRIKKKVKWK